MNVRRRGETIFRSLTQMRGCCAEHTSKRALTLHHITSLAVAAEVEGEHYLLSQGQELQVVNVLQVHQVAQAEAQTVLQQPQQ